MSTKPFLLAPRALVRDAQGRYLFLRRSARSKNHAGKWEPPGGKMDPGEAIDETLVREVFEETGLKVGDLHVAGATEGEGPHARFVALMMEAVAQPGAVRLSEEHDDYVWATPAEAAQLDVSSMYAEFIKTWSAGKGN